MMKSDSNNKKKVGMLIWSLNNGGAERAVANLSKTLSKKYDIHLMIFDSSVIDYTYTGTLHILGKFRSNNFFGKAFCFFKRAWLVWKCKKDNQIKTTISFMPLFNLYNALTKGNGKIICSIRTNMSMFGCSYFWRKCLIWCGKKADKTVAVSESARQDLIKNFSYCPNKTITILNMCDTAVLQETNPKIEALTSNFDFSGGTFVAVGRLEFEKAQWHLLKAFSLVCKKYPSAKLVLFGQGSLEKSLKEYAAKLNIAKNTFFMGYVRNQHTFLRKCDVFVLSSFSEGISNALLEAMACGLPIISTDCQSEILNNDIQSVKTLKHAEYGILVPCFKNKPFNEKDFKITEQDKLLAEAMEQLLTDKELNLHYRSQSLKRIKDFSSQVITEQWIKVIEN